MVQLSRRIRASRYCRSVMRCDCAIDGCAVHRRGSQSGALQRFPMRYRDALPSLSPDIVSHGWLVLVETHGAVRHLSGILVIGCGP